MTVTGGQLPVVTHVVLISVVEEHTVTTFQIVVLSLKTKLFLNHDNIPGCYYCEVHLFFIYNVFS